MRSTVIVTARRTARFVAACLASLLHSSLRALDAIITVVVAGVLLHALACEPSRLPPDAAELAARWADASAGFEERCLVPDSVRGPFGRLAEPTFNAQLPPRPTRAERAAAFLAMLDDVAAGARDFHRDRFELCVAEKRDSACPLDAEERVRRRCAGVFTGTAGRDDVCGSDAVPVAAGGLADTASAGGFTPGAAACSEGLACGCSGVCVDVVAGAVPAIPPPPIVDSAQIFVPRAAGADCTDLGVCGTGPFAPLECDYTIDDDGVVRGACVERSVVALGEACDPIGPRLCADRLQGVSCARDDDDDDDVTAPATCHAPPPADSGDGTIAAPFVPGAAVVSAAVTGAANGNGDGACSF